MAKKDKRKERRLALKKKRFKSAEDILSERKENPIIPKKKKTYTGSILDNIDESENKPTKRSYTRRAKKEDDI